MSRITVTTKLNEEEYERLKEITQKKGLSMSGMIKNLCEREIERGEEVDELADICFWYEIDKGKLIKNIRWLMDSGKLNVKEGRLYWNPIAMNPEYVSVDDKIDMMKISEIEKRKIKRMVVENLDRMDRQDDGLGNGAGV